MKLLLTSSAFFIILTAHGQSDKESMDFLSANCHYKITRYTDSLSHETITEMKNEFDTQFRQGYTWARRLKITMTEKKFVDRQLIAMRQFTWKSKLFGNAKYIARDTISNLLGGRDSTGREYIIMGYEAVYGFSKPIFLRNNTICFFYQQYNCGPLCGSGQFSVYIKVNGRWKMKYLLEDWIS